MCLDFDGTLAPIVDEPEDAELSEENRRLLRRLAGRDCVEVAIVSGRSLADLRDRVGVRDVVYAGNHGLEWDRGAGTEVVDTDLVGRKCQEAIGDLTGVLERKLDAVSGCVVEDKALTATVHYRQTPTEYVSAVERTVRTVAAATAGVRCRSGKQILELEPDVDAGKGTVVEVLRREYPERVPVFVGDDVTDEDGFRAVGAGGEGVLVGDRSDTAAAARITHTGGVTMLLGWLVQLSPTAAREETD